VTQVIKREEWSTLL